MPHADRVSSRERRDVVIADLHGMVREGCAKRANEAAP